MEQQDTYNLVYSKMNKCFTSNQFSKELRKLKAPNYFIEEQVKFLHQKCKQRDTRRTWIKNNNEMPHYIKDAKKMTVTVVPQSKEKEFIESINTAQPQQLKTFSLLWGLLIIKF